MSVFFQWWIFGTIAGVSGGLLYAIDSVNASDAKAMPAKLPWGHKEHLKGYDHARLETNDLHTHRHTPDNSVF